MDALSSSSSSSSSCDANEIQVRRAIATAGISPILQKLGCKESVRGYRSSVLTNNQRHDFTIERVAASPQLFLLRNFCTSLECQTIREVVSSSMIMEKAQTLSGETKKRTKCDVAWLRNQDIDSLVGSLAQAAGNILISDSVKRSSKLGCEDLQVLKYEENGKYVLHHDGNNRIVTVIYYLNGSGSTWFPFAKNEFDKKIPQNLQEAKALSENMIPGTNGMLLSCDADNKSNDHCYQVQEGDAIAFFNYSLDDIDGTVGLTCDWSSFHAGLPASSTKWIANHWFKTA